jgi:Ni/Fe-hydrogenase subunit HybB-like protein
MFTFFHNRITGDYTVQFWGMFICNAIIPQLLWFKKVRQNFVIVFIISLLINLGMWFERFNIVVTSLTKNYLPSAWASYTPTFVEVALFLGTLGIFSFGVLLFFRYIPMIAISEVKAVNKFQHKKKK